jgi:KDO2-lipid IV(A) lauroyltransferase
MKYWLFRIGIIIIPHLPGRLVQRTALAIGWLMWALLPGPRRQVRENLRHVPRLAANPPALRRAVRQVFGNSILNYVDFFRISTVTKAQLDKYWHVVGMDLVKEALAKGRGCIVISGHIGNFDYAVREFINLGYTITITQEHLQPERLHQLVAQRRHYPGVTWVVVDSPGALRQLFGALRRNEVVIMPADRDLQGHGEVVQFFGSPARLPQGSIQLAQRTGAPVFGVFPYRNGLAHGFGDVQALPPLTPEEEAAAPDALHRDLRRVAKLLERQIEYDPGQWVVFQPIWEPASAALADGQAEESNTDLQQPETPSQHEKRQADPVS